VRVVGGKIVPENGRVAAETVAQNTHA